MRPFSLYNVIWGHLGAGPQVAILSKLQHDSIVQIYDLPEPTSSTFQELYIVMEILGLANLVRMLHPQL